jgi:lipopolysaccharide transport system ATP-binding protein
MEDVSKSGRTILFVSHNMSAIESLCSNSILLKDGQVNFIGPSSHVIQQYLNLMESSIVGHSGMVHFDLDQPDKPIRKVEVLCDDKKSSTAYMGCRLEIRVYFKSNELLESPMLGLIIKDNQNMPMIGVNNKHYPGNLSAQPVSEGYVSMTIPYLTLFEGIYSVDIYFSNAFRDIQVIPDSFRLIVEPMKFTDSGEIPDKKFNRFFIKDITWKLDAQ